MTAVDAQDLQERTAEVLRRLWEDGEPIDITDRGRVVARLVPAEDVRPTREEIEEWLAELDATAAEIGKHWPEGVSAAQAISEDRREL
jgi:prevent-host-death family protein